jgi:small-conductance mechanosensitive channel
MIPTIYLLPKLAEKNIRLLIVIVFIAYHILLFQNYLSQDAFAYRLTLYVSEILLLFILLRLRFSKGYNNPTNGKWNRLIKFIVPLYILLMLSAIVANTIGSLNLAILLTYGVLISLALSSIVLLFITILININLMVLKSRTVNTSIETLSSLREIRNKRVRPLFEWLGFFFWIYFTMVGFDVMSIFKELLVDVFSFHWELGSVSISIGGILSFLLILMVTFFISRIIASLLKDEWAIRSLPKGSSSGTSMVLRIIVVCVGFYLALTSAGIDLGKVGFIIGGLGVGIGFGLQNVVLNFIAGLILAFERPIIVGDVIMADMEKGVVSNIGVRASKIKRYDGSEVIIPNGDLISKKVTNYTLSDSKRRSLITVRTSVYADPNEVIELLTEAATNDERTLKDPIPKTYFKGYGDSSLDFHLLYWTYFEDTFEADSAIAINIYNLLKVKGIHLPIPRISIENEKEKT